MDFDTATDAIIGRFSTQYHLARSELIAFENLAQLKKQDGTYTTDPTTDWVRISIRYGDAFQVSLGKQGNRTFRNPGVVIVQVFVKANTGYDNANKIADAIADIFRGQTVSGVRFLATSPPQYVEPDGAWYQWNVRTNFEFDLTD